MNREKIEIKLNEADFQAENKNQRLSHEDVFEKLKKKCSRDCRGGEAVDHSNWFENCEDDDR